VSYSEESQTKCIGLTIETRPDYCLTPHLKDMLSYGCTRLEMGVQSIYEDVARDTNRGHTVESVKECFCLAKVSQGDSQADSMSLLLFNTSNAMLHGRKPDGVILSRSLPCGPPLPRSQNAGFKVVCHMMPDLPNVGWERDVECFREFFENPEFRTDGLKLYPTLVIRGEGWTWR